MHRKSWVTCKQFRVSDTRQKVLKAALLSGLCVTTGVHQHTDQLQCNVKQILAVLLHQAQSCFMYLPCFKNLSLLSKQAQKTQDKKGSPEQAYLQHCVHQGMGSGSYAHWFVAPRFQMLGWEGMYPHTNLLMLETP